jgi:glucokinase
MSASSQPVLVADIGGTNARFALADTSLDAPLLKDSIREYAVAEFPSLGDAARHHLEQIGATAAAACSRWPVASMVTKHASPTIRG